MAGHKRKKQPSSNNNSKYWDEVSYDQKIEELNKVIKDQKSQLEKLRLEKSASSVTNQPSNGYINQLNKNQPNYQPQQQPIINNYQTQNKQQINNNPTHNVSTHQNLTEQQINYLNITRQLNSTVKQINVETYTEKDHLDTISNKTFIAKFIGNNLNDYNNYFKLHKELKSCKPDLKITNAYINLKNELIIKVNFVDKENLIDNWPTKAFKNGIQYVQKIKKYFIALSGVDKSLDISN